MRPNILFLFTDQQRPDWFETRGDVPVRTPHLKALAERGVEFTKAICPSPVCAPCRSCVASGLEYDRCRVWSNDTDPPDGFATYHRRLRDEAGYHVMASGKFHVGNNQRGEPVTFDWGIDGRKLTEEWGFSETLFNAGKNQAAILMRRTGQPEDLYMSFLHERGLGWDHIEDYKRRGREGIWTSTFPTTLPDDAYFDNWITANGLDLLDRAPSSQPWYLEVNLQNPHHPWDITESMHAMYRSPNVDFPEPEFCDLDVTPEQHQEVRRNYAAMVEHLDECVGRFVAKLEARGELDRTLIVFSSDHGEMLADYSQWQKLSPLKASVGVPLFIAGPGVRTLGKIHAPATILDLHATFVEAAGLSVDEEIDSQSLSPILSGESESTRDVVLSGLSAWRMAWDGRYKLIKGYDPSKRYSDHFEPMHIPEEETQQLQSQRPLLLYDSDTNEKDNIAENFPDKIEELSGLADFQ